MSDFDPFSEEALVDRFAFHGQRQVSTSLLNLFSYV
jgi:hypothetical protein